MKKAIGLILALALCAALLSGCSVAAGNDRDYTRGNATVTEAVENLEIDWTSGRIIIAYHPENTILLEETAKGALSEDNRMRWQVRDKTLKVVFNKPGLLINTCPAKELTVTLPEGMKWKTAKIGATSGDLAIPSLEAENVILGLTSGKTEAAVKADTVKVSATSGDMRLTLEGRIKSVDVGSTSGSLDVRLDQADELKLRATSGVIRLDAERVGKAEIGTTSGNILLDIGTFEDLKVSGTSAQVEAHLGTDPGFAGEITTTSGNVNSALPLRKDGKRYSCGDGSARLTIGTTSGDVTILERDAKNN